MVLMVLILIGYLEHNQGWPLVADTIRQEYPGATDRGGHDDDGANYSQFLKELRGAIEKQPTKYIISFTAPTSYWYLRHFDIKNMMDYVDFANVMSELSCSFEFWLNPLILP